MSQEAKIDPSIIKRTQDTLGRIIQAPSLTEKLLSRPPVQFIQDIVKSVVKNTGFMKGLYSSEELDGAFLKASKENKLLFLNKLIIVVGVVTGEPGGVKASKIAAGSEVEKTNELLQALAKSINMKPDNDECVKKALKKLKAMENDGDEKEDKKEDKEKDKERSREKSRDKPREEDDKPSRDKSRSKPEESSKSSRDKDREKDREREKDKEREKDRDREKDRRDKDRDREKDREKDRDRERDRDKEKDRRDRDKDRDRGKESERDREKAKERDREKEKERDRDRDREKDSKDSKSSSSRKEKETSSTKEAEDSRSKSKGRRGSKNEEEISKDSRGRSDKTEDDSKAKNDDNDQSESDPSANRRRPSSARGPRVQIERDESTAQEKLSDTMERSFARPTTARPGAPRPRLTNEPEETIQPKLNSSVKGKSTVIVHGDSDSDDDFVVKENKFQDEDTKTWQNPDEINKNKDDQEDENHGALVKKMLESKEQLEYGSELNRNKEFQKPVAQMDVQRKKEKERVQKEIDKLRESIQTLTKASIPLGRTLDFLQEDIDMMQKEITKWSDEYDLNLKALLRQQTETRSILEPYRSALSDIDNQISEQLEKIAAIKHKIHINDGKINNFMNIIGK